MTLPLTRALKDAQRTYRQRFQDLQQASQHYRQRMMAAGLYQFAIESPASGLEYDKLQARISHETGYGSAYHACTAAESGMIAAARDLFEHQGFRECARTFELPPETLASVFREGPKTLKIRRELVRICLEI